MAGWDTAVVGLETELDEMLEKEQALHTDLAMIKADIAAARTATENGIRKAYDAASDVAAQEMLSLKKTSSTRQLRKLPQLTQAQKEFDPTFARHSTLV